MTAAHARINLERLLTRLEKSPVAVDDASAWYKTNATLSTVLHARSLADSITASAIVMDGLRARVDALESNVRSQLASISRPRTPRRRAMPPPPVAPVIAPVVTPAPVTAEDPLDAQTESARDAMPTAVASAEASLLPLPTDDAPAARLTRRASSMTGSSPADLSTLLQHHREMQDNLGDDLAAMAKQLKLNTLHFQSSLAADKLVMEEAEGTIGGNLVGMQGQSGRLKAYRKKGGLTTCFTIMAVAGVAVAWVFMFGLLRVT